MDKYNIVLIKNTGKAYNITKFSSGLTWSDDLETLGTKLNFAVARNADDKYLQNYDIVETGDKVLLYNDTEEVFRGIITDTDLSRYGKAVTCFDYAFYLNQSKTVKQFYKIQASKAIIELCKAFSVEVGKIDAMNTLITKIYKDKTIAEIIKDIIEQATKETGIKYRLEMRAGKIYIVKYIEISIDPVFYTSESESFKILNAIGEITKSESIQEMKNSILVTSDDEKSSSIKSTSKDVDNIEKYGLLQEVITVDKKNESQAKNIANNKLKELKKKKKNITLSLLGSDELRAGRILTINNKLFNLSGKYLIKSSSHTVNNSIHNCSVTVEKAV